MNTTRRGHYRRWLGGAALLSGITQAAVARRIRLASRRIRIGTSSAQGHRNGHRQCGVKWKEGHLAPADGQRRARLPAETETTRLCQWDRPDSSFHPSRFCFSRRRRAKEEHRSYHPPYELAHEMGIPCIRLNSGRWKTIKSFDELMARRGEEPPGWVQRGRRFWLVY